MDDYENSFQKYLKSLAEKPISTLRFFDRQDYYNVYDDDAEFLAKCYYKSMEVIKHFKKGTVAYINISKNSAEGVFRYLLVNNQFKVEMYAMPNKRGEESGWSLQYTVSPGTLEKYQDVLFGSAEIATSNTILSVNIERSGDDLRVLLAFCDLDNRVFMLGNFLETAAVAVQEGEAVQPLANLTSALFQLPCRECLIPSLSKDRRIELATVANTVRQAGLLVSESSEGPKVVAKGNMLATVARLVSQPEAVVSKMIENEGGEGCLRCLVTAIKHIGLDTDDSLNGLFDLQSFRLDCYLSLGSESSSALHVLPVTSSLTSSSFASVKNSKESLYGLLNVCRTGLGERLLLRWLKQPLLDLALIEHRLDLVQGLVEDSVLRQGLHDGLLRRVPDLQRLTKRMLRAAATLQDLHKVYLALRLANEVSALLEGAGVDRPCGRTVQEEFIADLEEVCEDTAAFCEMIEATMDLKAIEDSHEFRIKADVDEGLRELRDKMDAVVPGIQTEFNKVCDLLHQLPRKALKLEVSANIGYYVRVSRKDEKNIRDEKSVIVIETLKDGVKFQSNKMQSMNDSYLQYRSEYEESQKGVIKEIIKIAGGYVAPLHKLGNILAKLDVICSLAVTVVSAPEKYVRPKLLPMENRKLNLKNCRHPLIEAQANVSYIANDIFFDEAHTFQIVTGPNMGGKSTYLRSAGLCVILAQIGSFVPCDEAELSLCDRVMTRIGSGDCQLKGVSTFMAEMLDISWILKTATRNSLIIIDELGRGTSTFDGFGLAWSISEYLINELRAFSLFATHFHELTQLQSKFDNVVNMHVSVQTGEESLVFLYRVVEGPSTKSYGIEVGKVAGLPDAAIALAREKLLEYEGGVGRESRLVDEEIDGVMEVIEGFCDTDIGLDDDDGKTTLASLHDSMGL